ncbi:MAG: FAD-binding oxidoreductase [Deltaproteobacteria bacterium]|nr:FAD-binding oxidoreductase [Deltaproteobacteria bacterium]
MTDANSQRIVPNPPSPRVEERLDGWGFADSGFRLDDAGEVEFGGSRYAIGGKKIPSLLPWGTDIFASPLDTRDRNAPRYPTKVPERVVNEPFERALAEKLDPARISIDPKQRLRHGHGHTQEDMWGAKWGEFARVPDLVVWPTSGDEVRVVIELARAHRACVIPFGGGTNVTDALRCLESEKRTIVSLDMRRMNRVLWIDAENRTACIQAGATGSEIEEVLGRHGFTCGHEPDSMELSTLGGWVATNASGMKKNRYGNIEDLLLSISAITPEGGELARAPSARESVGGDPARWLIGSEGRLGVVTSAVVKVFPRPAVRRFGSVLFKSFEQGFAFVRDVERAGCKPASIRLMDNLQFQFGQAVKPAKTGAAALMSRIEKAFVLGVKGFDANQMVACTLLFEGTEQEVSAQERGVYALAKQHRGMKAGAENGKRGYELTFAIAYIRDFIMQHWVVAESFETTVPWSQVLSVVNGVKRRVSEEHAARKLPGKPFISVRVTQLYEAGACLYFYFAFYYKGVEHPSEVFAELERAARDEILKNGGSLSHHHGIGKLRASFLPRVFTPAALAWRERMKHAFDPENVLGSGNG